MFIDEIKVLARAGAGGKGCVAFLRETFRPKGGPSGGNGGRGGSVILEADHDLNNLIAQYYVPRLIAKCGEAGMGKGMDGHAGEDLIVKIPCGTLVWKWAHPESGGAEFSPAGESHRATPRGHASAPKAEKSGAEASSLANPDSVKPRSFIAGANTTSRILYAGGERAVELNLDADTDSAAAAAGSRHRGELVADLTTHGQRFVLCKGGRGGLGNRNFATSTHQAPRFAQPGETGEEGEFLLELRIMADAGLVGYPNAGKSTLLTAISRARPKIAPYPFTTLHPQIGIVEYQDWHRLTVCDVPGLIDGAHQNVGLGHAFLRHIQRCKIIALMVDMAGTDGRHPWDDYRHLLQELEHYDPTLLERPRFVIANKMDEAAAVGNLPKFKRRIRGTLIIPMAAAFDEGVDRFKQTMREAVDEVSD